MALLTASAVAVLSMPATARTLDIADPRGDLFTHPPAGKGKAPRHAEGDILRTVFQYDRRVRIRIDLFELQRSRRESYYSMTLVTSSGARRDLTVNVDAEATRGQGYVNLSRGGDDPIYIDCPIRHTVDYRSNVVTIEFPRSCIGNPPGSGSACK